MSDAAVRLRDAMVQLSALLRGRAELGELASAVARDACKLVEADSCAVMLLDAQRAVLSSYAAHGLTPEETREIRFRVGEGVAGSAVADKRPVNIADVQTDPRFASRAQTLHIRSILAVPVIVRGDAIGCLCVTHRDPGKFGDTEETLLDLWAQAVGMDLEAALLYRLSLTDPLTRAYNRRYLDEVVARQFSFGEDAESDPQRRVAALFVDMDRFKQVNDRHGHEAGDAVLVETAARIMACVRTEDIVLRYGGDEFLVLLVSSSAQHAATIAARIDEDLRKRPMHVRDADIFVTASVGIAADGSARSFEDLLLQVDRAMYEAKLARARLDEPLTQ